MSFLDNPILVGARGSQLSLAQVQEVLQELQAFHPEIRFLLTTVTTTGDKDKTISLRTLEKSDFFTKEIDKMQIDGFFRISIHSAKDLPEPLREGLSIIALTKGVNPCDSLVFPKGGSLETLPYGGKVGTSSTRREENIKRLRSDLVCIDVRGTIQERLQLLEQGKVDALIIAEAALIRLKLTHLPRIFLQGELAKFQGQLAIIGKQGDEEMQRLFAKIDSRTS